MTGPVNDMWRVDVCGVPVTVRGRLAKDHLEQVNHQIAELRLERARADHHDRAELAALRTVADVARTLAADTFDQTTWAALEAAIGRLDEIQGERA